GEVGLKGQHFMNKIRALSERKAAEALDCFGFLQASTDTILEPAGGGSWFFRGVEPDGQFHGGEKLLIIRPRVSRGPERPRFHAPNGAEDDALLGPVEENGYDAAADVPRARGFTDQGEEEAVAGCRRRQRVGFEVFPGEPLAEAGDRDRNIEAEHGSLLDLEPGVDAAAGFLPGCL